MRQHIQIVATLVGLVALPGCLIDDTGGSRGQSNAPSASVPDSGSPLRRESPTKTLDDAEPNAPRAPGETLDVGSESPGR